MIGSATQGRRDFLATVTGCGGLILASQPGMQASQTARPDKGKKEKEQEEGVSPVEDLMREHGVLRRILLIYRNAVERQAGPAPAPAQTISGSANIVRRFIEAYHEKLEEDHLFPRMRKAGKLTDLVEVLDTQHKKGRVLTERILKLSSAELRNEPARMKQLSDAMMEFIRMYEPHAAREDTVLFPAFHELLPEREYDELGDQFEKKEHELFGSDGFEKMVAEVSGIEQKLGIYDLSKFTPQI